MGITLEEGQRILEEMLRYCLETKPGRPSSIAVVDTAAILVCFARMDGAFPLTARMAFNKAFTCIDWRRDTKEIREMFFTGEEKREIAWFGESRLAPIPGGVLLRHEDGEIVGAVGTSGRTADEDEELARMGARIYGDMPKNKG